MLKTILAALILFSPAVASAKCVVLLHGLARGSNSLFALEYALEADGYKVVNQGYPSTKATVQELVESTFPPAVAECGDEEVNFVTHSMGGDFGSSLGR